MTEEQNGCKCSNYLHKYLYGNLIENIYEPYWSSYLHKYDVIPNSEFKFNYITNQYAVIIEPRKTPLLRQVIKNFMYKLHKQKWGLIVFHGTENDEYIKQELVGMENVYFENIGVDNLNSGSYSGLLTSAQFWEMLIIKYLCQWCLIFQTDTLLLKDNIADFMNYDYVGAPWKDPLILGDILIPIGNGGLSLRNTVKMLTICRVLSCQSTPEEAHLNEDVYFAVGCKYLHFSVPSEEVAAAFSVETIFCKETMGFHHPHLKTFLPGEYETLMQKYIETEEL